MSGDQETADLYAVVYSLFDQGVTGTVEVEEVFNPNRNHRVYRWVYHPTAPGQDDIVLIDD